MCRKPSTASSLALFLTVNLVIFGLVSGKHCNGLRRPCPRPNNANAQANYAAWPWALPRLLCITRQLGRALRMRGRSARVQHCRMGCSTARSGTRQPRRAVQSWTASSTSRPPRVSAFCLRSQRFRLPNSRNTHLSGLDSQCSL